MDRSLPRINNAFYEDLNDGWYDDDEHPVALLRAEGKTKLAYIESVLKACKILPGARILDIGCGAGLTANPLAQKGYRVTGVDISANSITTARKHAPNSDAVFSVQDAYHLSEESKSYDVVLMLDFLEHVEDAGKAITEAARVLRDGGIFIYHTFNRTLLARLLVIKAVELFSKNCPEHMHVYHLFRTPAEVEGFLTQVGLSTQDLKGIRPHFLSWPFWSSVFRRRLHKDFRFVLVRSKATGYIGFAKKAML